MFYEELHTNENVLIRETRPDDAHVLLEALKPPAEVRARMAEEESVRQAQEAEQSGQICRCAKAVEHVATQGAAAGSIQIFFVKGSAYEVAQTGNQRV